MQRIVFFSCLFLMTDFSHAQNTNLNGSEDSRGHIKSIESYAAIEFAEYRARFSAGDLVDGSFRWDLLHRGENAAEIQITDSNLAMKDLQSSLEKIVWGTTQQGRRIVLIDSDMQFIDGVWSLHGRRYPGRTAFDCMLPPALNSQLIIQAPIEFTVQSSVGFVQSRIDAEEPQLREWTIDFGRHRNASISLIRESLTNKILKPTAEVETVYVARQDGFFIQSDFTIEGLTDLHSSNLEIANSNSINIQSVTSNGVPLDYQQKSNGGKTLLIALPESVPRSRVNLRIQGFKPVRWVRQHTLPTQTLVGAIETKRVASLRIESPLEIHAMQQEGYFQSGLTEEQRGEIWKFEAYQENPKLVVDLGQPNTSLKAEIHSLHYLDTPLPWVVSKVTTSVKSGRLFKVSFKLPDGWTIVSVHSLNFDSEISSWSVDQGQLEVLFKKPMTTDSNKSIEILARTGSPELNAETTFPILRAIDTSITSVQSDWILPPERDIDLSTNSRWNPLTSKIELNKFTNLFPINNVRQQQIQRSYFNSNVHFETTPSFRFVSELDLDVRDLDVEEPSITSPANSDELDSQRSAPSGQLHLLTQADSLGDLSSPRLVHHASINFAGRVSPKVLKLKLSKTCLLSSVSIDDQAVTVFRDGEMIIFPEAVESFNHLTLIYITESARSFLSEDCEIPLPVAAFPFTEFHWALEIPNEQNLNQVEIPGTDFPLSNQYFFFGPLSANRFSANLTTNPHTDADPLATLSEKFNIHHTVKKYEFHTLSSVPEVRFKAWNSVRASNLGWVAFFACMIIGIGGRLMGSQFIRRLSPYWLLFLISLQIWMTNEFSMISGAMLAGTLISILLPVEFLSLPATILVPKATRKFASASLLCGLLFNFSLTAQENATVNGDVVLRDTMLRDTVPENRNTSDNIRFLLRSVIYHADSSNSNLFRAKIEVLTPQTAQETLVELPYQGIVFQAGAECLVDNQKQTLIPAVTGKGVVIRVPTRMEATEGNDSNWQSHFIQFEFTLREGSDSSTESAGFIKFPMIQDSTLQLNQNSLFSLEIEPQAFERMGQLDQYPTGEINVALGPIESFFHRQSSPQENPIEPTYYTLLNLSAARVTGQLFIPQQNIGTKNHLILNVPDAMFITNVSGQNISQWFLSQDERGQHSLIVEYKPDSTGRETAVSFHLPTSINTKNEIVLPELNWKLNGAKQMLGIKAPNGIAIELATDQTHLKSSATESWPQNELFGRTRPQIILNLNDGQGLRFALRERTPSTKYSLSETVTVERAKITWQATVDIEVSDMPLFVHNFELHSGLRINSVHTRERENLSQLRFFQNDENLSVFIPGGQLGAKSLILTGDVSFTPESNRSLPGIAVKDSELLTATMSIYDQTNWQIELTRPDGTILKKDSLEDENMTSNRLIGEFSESISDKPIKIRLLPPPSATRVDIATRIHIDDSKTWNCVQLLHFLGNETPLKRVKFTVPNGLQNVRIGPRYFRTESIQLDEATEYTIPIPERFSDEVTIQVYSKLSQEFVERLLKNQSAETNSQVPTVQISSARTVSQFLFFNNNRFVMVPELESLPVERKNLPQWIPLQWQEAVTSLQLQAHQITEGTPSLIAQKNEADDAQPRLYFAETILWPSQNQKVIGMTRLWLTGAHRFNYKLPFNDDIQITRASSTSKGLLSFSDEANRKIVHIENFESASPLLIYWESKLKSSIPIQSPLESGTSQSTQQLIGVVGGNHIATQKSHQIDDGLMNSLIYRWQALLEIADSIQVPVAVESPLYKELIESDALMNELFQQHNLSDNQRNSIEESKRHWEKVSEKLTISAGPVLAKNQTSISTFELLGGPQNQFQSVEWILPNVENEFHIRLSTDSTFPAWGITTLKSIGLFVLFALLYRFRSVTMSFAISIQKNPVARLLILGGIWLLFFQLISVGLILIVLAFTLQVSRETKPKMISQSAT